MIIVLEGIDGSGKSTLTRKLLHHFNEMGKPTKLILSRSFHDYSHEKGKEFFTDARRLKKMRELRPLSLCLWHAADFSYRLETEVFTEESETIFIMDRYIYTPMVRDSVRGIEMDYLKTLYSFAPRPDKVFLLTLPPKVALQRVIARSGKPGYYESGSDFKNNVTFEENFLEYQAECQNAYKTVIPSGVSTLLDAELEKDTIFEEVKQSIELKN